ncbi:hypothetical protein [Maribacter sp.]|nr:hypothetical protein [Maribacter sp.]
MLRKKKKRKAIETQAVFVKNNEVFFRKNKSDSNRSEEWQPVVLQWISV